MIGVGSTGAQGPTVSPGVQGTNGGKGDPGKSWFDAFCKWVPNLALDGFRKEEVGCFLLADPYTDVKRDKSEYCCGVRKGVSYILKMDTML